MSKARATRPGRPVVAGDAEVPLDALKVGPSLRVEGLDARHVATLAELGGGWTPIVVRRDDRSVVDGQHRVAAARRLGLGTLQVTWFDGSAEDAFVEFVRCNVGHGLPLGLAERRSAASRILRSHPERSDRSVASVCGVSPKTVARLRGEVARHAPRQVPARRVGRDGRVRPVDPAELRARDRGRARASARSVAARRRLGRRVFAGDREERARQAARGRRRIGLRRAGRRHRRHCARVAHPTIAPGPPARG